jgi:hypothetical protein
MAERNAPGYGTPNREMIGRWLELPPEDDGPFWALNLMQYRPVADYGDGEDRGRSGREADDAYAPLGPLEAIGAMVAFHADVVGQPLGDPTWDRVGIVRYPSRAAFFAMQQREDFKAKHVHKEAGMAQTIVLSCRPEGPASASGSGGLVLTVERRADDEPPGAPHGAVAAFSVEGVIVGDGRTWSSARFDRAADAAASEALVAAAATAEEAFVLVLEPLLDRLVESIETAP